MATKPYAGAAAEVGRPSTKIRAEQVQSEDSFTSLAIDLAALRGQISDIIGGSEGYTTKVDEYDVQLAELNPHLSGSYAGDILKVKQKLEVTLAADLKSTLDVASAANLASTLDVQGAATLEDGLTVNTSVADFNAGVTANEIKIDGDTAAEAGHLYIVGAAGEIVDEAKLVFDGSELAIDGDLAATNAAFAGDVSMLDLTAVSGSFSGDVSMGDLTAVIGAFSGNVSMVNLSAADGAFSGNVTISGDLTITGTTTTVDSTNLVVEDNMITLNRNETGAAGVTAGTAGVEIERGALDNAFIQWEESADKFELKVGAASYADLKIDDLEAAAGTFSGNVSMVNLTAANGDFSGTLDADGAAVLGSTLSVAGVASFADAVTGSAGLKITAGLAEFAGGVLANEIKISGDIQQRLYIVGATGQIEDEAKLTFDGSELWVDGAFETVGAAALGSTLDVAGAATLASSLDVAGLSYFAENITLDKAAAAQSILKTGGNLTISGSNDLRLAAGQAMKFVDVFRESSIWSSAQGVQLASAASSWTAYKNAFGGTELSLLDAIATVATGAGGGKGKWAKTYSGAAGTSVVFASGDKVGSAGSAPAFPGDLGRTDIYLNGQLMAAGDISSLSAATVTFTFNVQPDDVVVAVIR
jgi:cytoskeletal protein CcmA (bactofilin family)